MNHYAVEIKINHESVLYISDNELSGVNDIEKYADEIRHIANSLLGFIGEKKQTDICLNCGGWLKGGECENCVAPF